MDSIKHNNKEVQEKPSSNPFIKLFEDKKKIVTAIQNGKSLSMLKGIKFIKPI